MRKPLLQVRDLTLQYKSLTAMHTTTWRLTFDVYNGERFIILGPSGCGKSSLFKAIGGFLKPVEGHIFLDGNKIEKPGIDRTMVFQESDQLLPWKTVMGNVMFPLIHGKKMPKKEAEDIACATIAKVYLETHMHKYPHELSGGMKARVAIARGLAIEPRILLMDEPFAALDALTRLQMQNDLLEVLNHKERSLLFITHDISEAVRLGTRILLLSAQPAQILAEINGVENQESIEEINALEQRIHNILFSDQKVYR